ncbi:hypothetical protein LOTGIDRAFT_164153 [Lottia gigantea]|uniref:Phosphoserine phosphatase n=1 Tax=Lottia gigantea TaxID=225164 RepID=V3ZH47_LOTGI|nr:hypothetical protein LOTGIDRAFT_164153 [Lottia gigantea]ESO90563.1 hypothetical protein LOTGIDRAFT_164153 [Lottia gigantea]
MEVIDVKCLWRTADAVCFDVDSTVCQDEGLDELASFCGVGEEVAQWTKKAMGGGVSFREALRSRLNIINPSKDTLNSFIKSHDPALSPRFKELVDVLKKENKDIYLVSGGFRSIIEPVAKILNISTDHIFANRLLFDDQGKYIGFDENEATSESGGKKRVVELLIKKYNYKNVIMVGDGATDMEASPPASAFIGYGGNVVRENVKNNAKWFITDFQELITELDNKIS